jgi:hypothetical protein
MVALIVVGSIVAGCASDSDTTDEVVDTAPATASTTDSVASAEPVGATLVTGTTTFSVSEGTVTVNDDGSSSSRGGTVTEELVSDDLRVAGTAEGTWEADRWEGAESNGALVQWGTSELTNDGGSWRGDYSGVRTTETGDLLARWWQGAGEYEGLTFFMWITDGSRSPWEWSGVVFAGAPPLTSEPRVEDATGEPIGDTLATLATGTFRFQVSGGTNTAGGDGPGLWRDWVFLEDVTSDDERVTGVMEGTWAADVWAAQQTTTGIYAQVQWGTASLTNDAGSWEGVYSAMYEREDGDVRISWWTGSGDHEGLTLFMWATADSAARRRSGSPAGTAIYEWTGLVYSGAPPFAEAMAER